MTCAVLTPWWLPRQASASGRVAGEVIGEVAGGIAATTVLDTGSAPVLALAAAAREAAGQHGEQVLLQQAHRLIAAAVRPVYAVEEFQAASVTLRRGRGSCSQRAAVLEAVARSCGIATRCRGLLVDGALWSARFPRSRRVLPDVVVLAWPEFLLGQRWVPLSEVFGPVDPAADGFTNTGAETLFDAVARGAVDWDGAPSCSAGGCTGLDLPAAVLADLGRFTSRDELFAVHGQTLSRAVRVLADPVLSRCSAGAS